MSVLYVRDKEGNLIAVPCISGGISGEDGFSPIVTVEQTKEGAIITITDADGTTTATIKNGNDGDDGNDGYTPVKGTDYWNDEDLAEIRSYMGEWVTAAYEKGTPITSGKDLNSYGGAGKYYSQSSTISKSLKNCPTTQNFTMWVFLRTDRMPTQVIIDMDGKLYVRGEYSEGWRDWTTYLNDLNIIDIISDKVTNEIDKKAQVKPEFADNNEWLDDNGDTTKLYVLPDGYIYAYMVYKKQSYTNQIPLSINANKTEFVGENGEDGYKTGYRLNSSGTETSETGSAVTGFIEAKAGQTVYFKNFTYAPGVDSGNEYIVTYKKDFSKLLEIRAASGFASISYLISAYTVDDNGYLTSMTLNDTNADVCYIRVSEFGLGASTIITVDEPITDVEVDAHGWRNTGHAFVPADYEDRILKAETDITTIKNAITGDMNVYGIVDSDNNIIMTGTLTSGTYSLKYMAEDGTTTDIGTFTME